MRPHKLKINNFRKIEDLTIIFPRGLCVIVRRIMLKMTYYAHVACSQAATLMLFVSTKMARILLQS